MEKQCLLENENKRMYKITVEPMVAVFIAVTCISEMLQTNLLLEKTCQLYNVEGGFCETETESEVIVSQLNTWKLFFGTILNVFCTTYAGPIIDQNPKILRPLIALPIFGHVLRDIGNYLSAVFWNWSPLVTAVYDTVFGICGSTSGILVFAVSYSSYTTDKNERTMRIGFLYFYVCIGLSFGYFISGYVTKYLGYQYGFLLCLLMFVVCFVIEIFFVKDVDVEPETLPEAITIFGTIRQNLKVLTKPRESSKQMVILFCIFVYYLISAYPIGEYSILYLFLRHQFGWDAVEYGVYMSFRMIVKCFGAFICVELLERRLKLHDTSTGIIGCSLQLAAAIGWLLIWNSWQVYLITTMGLFEKAIIAVVMSVATKCVEQHEYGRVTSLFGLANVLIPVVYPLYNAVYESGIDTFPNSIFLISTSLSALCLLIFCVLRYFSIKMCQEEVLNMKKNTTM